MVRRYKGSKDIFSVNVDDVRGVIAITNKAFKKGVKIGLKRSGLLVEKLATEECPKNTTQLSKTIGHYRVDPDTAYDAKLEYGKVQDPSTAIWEEPSWDKIVLGTQADYAGPVHARSPFMTTALSRAAPEIIEIINRAIQNEVANSLKGRTIRKR